MKQLFKGGSAFCLLFLFVKTYSQQIVSTPLFRREFLENINYMRQRGCNCGGTYMAPALPIVWNNQLELSAIGHAADMAARNYFSHTSLDGRSVQGRIDKAGYTYKGYKSYAVGENIAFGAQTIAGVMRGWFKSPGHCKNLMNPDFKEVGAAENSTYWVQDFGGREVFSPETQRMLKSGRYHLTQKE